MSSQPERALIGSSKAMEELRQSIRRAADSDTTALIQGETGTGKELVARAIHRQSARSDRPFVAMNCASVQESLVESELFGYEKGAFTGADSLKKGKFEQADTGTLFLDEIGEISATIQTKLLRVLQEREIDRVGGRKPVPLNFRLIAATNRDLEKMTAEGTFRQDLYFRLHVDLICTPPLRERFEDIEELAEHFFQRFGRSAPRDAAISPEVLHLFRNYQWPGNIREFETVIQLAVRESGSGTVELEHLQRKFYHKAVRDRVRRRSYEQAMDDLSRHLCLWAFEAARGNSTRAADLLEMNRSTFYRLAKTYGLRNLAET